MFHSPVPSKFFTAKRLVGIAAVLTVGSMLIIASISYRTAESYLAAASRNDGASLVQITQDVLSSLKDAEAANRGFYSLGRNPI